jgi:hypothetical protein
LRLDQECGEYGTHCSGSGEGVERDLEAVRERGGRLAMTSQLLIALFVGLSIPVIGAGVALDQGASAANTVLGFAILVGLGVAGAGWGLLVRRPKSSPQVA